jgi:hypothetical protein
MLLEAFLGTRYGSVRGGVKPDSLATCHGPSLGRDLYVDLATAARWRSGHPRWQADELPIERARSPRFVMRPWALLACGVSRSSI